jgi:hypothetical protein
MLMFMQPLGEATISSLYEFALGASMAAAATDPTTAAGVRAMPLLLPVFVVPRPLPLLLPPFPFAFPDLARDRRLPPPSALELCGCDTGGLGISSLAVLMSAGADSLGFRLSVFGLSVSLWLPSRSAAVLLRFSQASYAVDHKEFYCPLVLSVTQGSFCGSFTSSQSFGLE